MAPNRRPDQEQDGGRTPGGGGGRPWWRALLRSQLWLWVIALIAVNLVVGRWVGTGSSPSTVQIAYSTFKDQVRANNVVDITNSGDTIDGHARKAVTSADGSSQGTDFTTTRPAFDDASLTPLLEAHGVTITAQSSGGTSVLLTLLFTFGPIALLVGLFALMMRRAAAAGGGAGLGGLGRSRARLYDRERPGVTFADVAGAEEAVAELGEVVDFLKEPDKYQRLGGAMPKGVLLVGPPGTGKTLLARAVAGEAQVPFFNVSASEFVEMIVGVGAARVRDLFAKARQAAPAIVFIDELDAVGRSRSAALRVGGHDEQEQTLNQILTEMDGFDSREGVVVLAATNRPDVLDSALLRPGRFDRNVTLEAPDRRGRAAILAIHTRHMPLAADVDIERVAAMTTGLVGADLKNLVNEAALLAARTGHDSVTAHDLDQAFEKTLLGAERHLAMSLEERRRIAYHEAGHALVGLLVPDGDPVRKVSIVPRGRALGVTLQVPVEDRRNLTEEYLRGRITGALGGRAAESVVLGTVTTGAEDDLRQATGIAHEMVVRWGMSPRVGPLQYTEQLEGSSVLLRPHTYSEATARMIDAEVKRIVDECFEASLGLLRGHRPQLAALAEAVLAAETLDEAEIRAVVDGAGRGAAVVTGSAAATIAIPDRPAVVAG